MAKLVSASDSSLHLVEMLGKDEKAAENGGSHPWSLEAGNESTLVLFNPSAESHDFTVLIYTIGALWEKRYELEPMHTEEIKLGKLILDGVQDDKGKSLPKDSRIGLVEWYSSTNGKGRMLVSNRDLVMARNFSCTGYYCLCNPQFSPGTTSFLISSTVGFGSLQGEICQSPFPGQCCNQGSPVTFTTNGSFSWSSYNSGVIQISGSSSSPSVSTFGAGGGSTNVSGQQCYNGCCVSTAPPGTVRVPYSARLVQTVWSRAYTCNPGTAGWDRKNTERVVDQFGQDFTFDNQTISESFTIGRNDLGLSCGAQGSNCSGTQNTYGGGNFNDEFFFCSRSCPGSTGETDASQVVYYNGIPLHNTDLIIYKCSSITWNGQ